MQGQTYGITADLWSLGLTLIGLATGNMALPAVHPPKPLVPFRSPHVSAVGAPAPCGVSVFQRARVCGQVGSWGTGDCADVGCSHHHFRQSCTMAALAADALTLLSRGAHAGRCPRVLAQEPPPTESEAPRVAPFAVIHEIIYGECPRLPDYMVRLRAREARMKIPQAGTVHGHAFVSPTPLHPRFMGHACGDAATRKRAKLGWLPFF